MVPVGMVDDASVAQKVVRMAVRTVGAGNHGVVVLPEEVQRKWAVSKPGAQERMAVV